MEVVLQEVLIEELTEEIEVEIGEVILEVDIKMMTDKNLEKHIKELVERERIKDHHWTQIHGNTDTKMINVLLMNINQ